MVITPTSYLPKFNRTFLVTINKIMKLHLKEQVRREPLQTLDATHILPGRVRVVLSFLMSLQVELVGEALLAFVTPKLLFIAVER